MNASHKSSIIIYAMFFSMVFVAAYYVGCVAILVLWFIPSYNKSKTLFEVKA